MHPEQPTMKQALMRGLGGPAVEAGEDLYQGAKRSGGELMQAGKSLLHGNPAEAAVHGMNAVPIVGPAMVNAAEKPDVGGTGSYSGDLMSVLKSPSAMGTLVGGAAQAAPIVAGAGDVMAPERAQFGQIPSRARAVKTLNSIEQQGADTPVSMIRSPEALADYQQHHLKPGGVTKLPLTRMSERIDEGPMNFPEARDYYSKVSTATRAPGWLGRAFEDPEQPQFRAAAGPVREAFNSDLERAADSFGRGEDYRNAMKEYGQNARMRSMAKKAAITGAGMAAGSAGLGKLHGLASSVLR
jgi:hypothetical protein